jgi:hypothetical protein
MFKDEPNQQTPLTVYATPDFDSLSVWYSVEDRELSGRLALSEKLVVRLLFPNDSSFDEPWCGGYTTLDGDEFGVRATFPPKPAVVEFPDAFPVILECEFPANVPLASLRLGVSAKVPGLWRPTPSGRAGLWLANPRAAYYEHPGRLESADREAESPSLPYRVMIGLDGDRIIEDASIEPRSVAQVYQAARVIDLAPGEDVTLVVGSPQMEGRFASVATVSWFIGGILAGAFPSLLLGRPRGRIRPVTAVSVRRR